MKKWKRNCPGCGNELSYTRRIDRDRAEKWNTNCASCAHKGIKFTDKRKKKISESMTGDKNPAKRFDVRKKISETLKGRKRSEETKLKMRLSRLKNIEKNNGQVMPNHNPVACGIIDEYNKKHGFNFQHAENGGEVCIGGYFPDGVDEKQKTIIEIDEPRHFNPDGTLKEKDIERQNYLEGLGYKFIRVKI